MTKLRFDPSFSWGDLGALISAVGFALAMWINLQDQVDQHERELERIEATVAAARAEVREVEAKDAQARDALRVEIKHDLAEISSKLDRLIEREIDGRRH